MRRWLRAAVSVALIAWLVSLVDWHELRSLLVDAAWLPLAAACAVLLGNRVITAAKWRVLLGAKGLTYRFAAALRTVWVSNFLGHFLPTAVGGDAVRMLTIASRSERAPEAVSTVVMERVTGVASLTALATVGAALGVIAGERHAALLAIVPAGGAALLALAMLWTRTGYRIVQRLSRLLPRGLGARFITKVHDAVDDYRRQPQAVTLTMLLATAVQVNRVTAMFLVALGLAVPLSFMSALMVVPAALFIGMLPISVGGLGVREGALVLFLGIAGVGSSAAFAVAVISRLTAFASNLPGAILLATHGLERGGVAAAVASSAMNGRPRARWLAWARARFGPLALQLRAVTRGRLRDRRLWIDRSDRDVEWVRIPAGDGDLAASLWRAADRGAPVPAMVLVHGSHGPLPLYRLLAHRLREAGVTILALEMPGFGASFRPRPPWRLEQFTGDEAIARAVSYLRGVTGVDPSRVSLFGHSFGGSAVVRAGLIVPGLGGVIALGPTRRVEERFAGESAPDALFWRARFAVARRLESWPDAELVRAFSRAIALEFQTGWERDGHPPLLLIDGAGEATRDREFLAMVAGRLAPPVEHRTIPRADHYLNSAGLGAVVLYDRAAVAACLELVRDWLAARSPAPPGR
ncbi:MAG TPA: flippase-like domain-containing protein [Gemmatimonadaceae bacterium]|nr:flippase-like domain-containing protein [Gemmatimonadaceae bacterium]